MNFQIRSLAELPHINAELHYLIPMTERPRNYACEPPAGIPRSNTAHETHTMPIHDVR